MMAARGMLRLGRGPLACVLLIVGWLGACSPEPEVLRFAAIGDMGTGGPGQRQIAAKMAERAREEPFDFWLALGDNIYPWGVLSPDDTLWDQKFEGVYDLPELRVPVYATLGNHDYLGLPLAQIQRSGRSATWTMPDRYYGFSRLLRDGTEVAFFALDTEMILSSLQSDIEGTPLADRVEMVKRGAERFEADLPDELARYIAERVHVEDGWTVLRIVMFAERTGREISTALIDEVLEGSGTQDYRVQLEWLEQELSESSARWKIVFGHHPLYTHNPWRPASQDLIDRLEPILVEGGVDVYVAGHDHFLDMMKPVQGVYHLTSGGGSGDDSPYEFEKSDASYYTATGGGFVLFKVDSEELKIDFIDLDGITRYSQVVIK